MGNRNEQTKLRYPIDIPERLFIHLLDNKVPIKKLPDEGDRYAFKYAMESAVINTRPINLKYDFLRSVDIQLIDHTAVIFRVDFMVLNGHTTYKYSIMPVWYDANTEPLVTFKEWWELKHVSELPLPYNHEQLVKIIADEGKSGKSPNVHFVGGENTDFVDIDSDRHNELIFRHLVESCSETDIRVNKEVFKNMRIYESIKSHIPTGMDIVTIVGWSYLDKRVDDGRRFYIALLFDDVKGKYFYRFFSYYGVGSFLEMLTHKTWAVPVNNVDEIKFGATKDEMIKIIDDLS